MEQLIEAGYCPNCKTFIKGILNAGPNPITDLRFCPNCGVQVWINIITATYSIF